MSESWKVHLVFSDGRSNKFWRARTEGSTVYTNYGRIGSEGQTSIKDYGSAGEAEAALDKQAASKRKKGYEDQEIAVESAPVIEPPTGPQSATLVLERGGRSIELTLAYDGQSVRTEVVETYDSPAQAGAAFTRIQQALVAEGYRKKA